MEHNDDINRSDLLFGATNVIISRYFSDKLDPESLSDERTQARIADKLKAAFVSIYGTDTVTPDMGERIELIPALLKANDGKIYLALMFLSVFNPSSNFGAILFHPQLGAIYEKQFVRSIGQEESENFYPYRYRLLLPFPNDRCSPEIFW